MAKKDDKNDDVFKKYIAGETGDKNKQAEIVINEIKDNNTMKFLNVDLNTLPGSIFYKKGTRILIRSASVTEIQAFSVIDENSPIDILDGINNLLKSCIKYFQPNGNLGSYKDVKDCDKIFLIFMIRELTFQANNTLSKTIECDFCKSEVVIPYRATPSSIQRTFINYEINDKLVKYYDSDEAAIALNINGTIWHLAPPTIGLSECFIKDIKDKVQSGDATNRAFLTIIPYTMIGANSISIDGIKAKLKQFKSLDGDTFQILNKTIKLMVFGINKLSMKCTNCEAEVLTDFVFPCKLADFLVDSSLLEKYY